MPQDPKSRREKQKAYRATAKGKAAAQRARDKFYAKRRGEKDAKKLVVDATALQHALSGWSMNNTKGTSNDTPIGPLPGQDNDSGGGAR